MKFKFDKASLVSAEQIVEQIDSFKNYEKLINSVESSKKYNFPESFVKLPFDEENIARALKLREKFMHEGIKYIVVIGIGGSNLGTKAVYESLYGYADVLKPNRFPKIVFLETLQPEFTKQVVSLVAKNETLIILVSKTGTTTESLANFQILVNNVPRLKSNVVVISNELSQLLEKSKRQNFATLSIPRMVTGRYSVFTAVGLFPLACAGINIVEFCEGGMHALSDIQGAEISASVIHTNYRNGKDILTNFYFDTRLEVLGKWQRQLLAESLGKKDYCGNPQGLTPEVSIGTTDMHSMLQLYLSGKNIRQFNFVKTHDRTSNQLSSKSKNTDRDILNETYDNVISVFEKRYMPFTETILEKISAHELGYYMQFKMLETAFLARLMQVNAFDQPDVDNFKKQSKD